MARSFSGIQPTGNIHLGNYLGALRFWIREQNRYDCFFSIVDLHAITSPQDPAEFRAKTLDTAAILLAIGIDPLVSTLFVQSHVQEHANLAWVLSSLTTLGELRRMTQFKNKASREHGVQTSGGLFVYPVLQAADLLLYQADRVLVGEDQRQHLELSRTLAGRFNHRFGPTFGLPEAVIPKVGARIMDLQDPRKKMSKSSDSQLGALRLVDTPEILRDKIRSAVTDSGREIIASADKPAITNLLTIYSTLTGEDLAVAEDAFAGSSYEQFKATLADVLIEDLRPIRERYIQWMSSPDEIVRSLQAGANQATTIASATLGVVYEHMGFLR
ncbi:MAG: tryptophan--tRNA ligase [Candidatus Acidiferrales bacterium]